MSDSKEKESISDELTNRLGDMQRKQSINYILSRIKSLKKEIIINNPLLDRFENDSELRNKKNDPRVNRLAGLFKYSFSVENGVDLQEEINNCIMTLQKVFDKAYEKRHGNIDPEKEFKFYEAMGALNKLHRRINPFTHLVSTLEENPYELIKYD